MADGNVCAAQRQLLTRRWLAVLEGTKHQSRRRAQDGHSPAIVAVLLNSLCGGPSARLSLGRSPLGGCGWSRWASRLGASQCVARRACPSRCDAGGLAAPVLISQPSTALSEDGCWRPILVHPAA
jgi:hypothetical protein